MRDTLKTRTFDPRLVTSVSRLRKRVFRASTELAGKHLQLFDRKIEGIRLPECSLCNVTDTIIRIEHSNDPPDILDRWA
jgi:hypothetical protein